MPDTDFLEPISLGYSCDIKYQLSRNLFFRIRPHASETDFRNMLYRWQGQATIFRRHLFDWQITPVPAVLSYLENDFHGVFERDDFCVGPSGSAYNRRLDTAHPHDFRPGPDGFLTDALIDEQYPAARAKFEYLAERFRQHLLTPGPYLYVVGQVRPLHEVKALTGLLSARSPGHQFKLLLVGQEGAPNQVLSELKGQVSKAWLPRKVTGKPTRRLWEGDDEAWDRVLQPFFLGLQGHPSRSPSRKVTQAVAGAARRKPPRSGWRSVLDLVGDSVSRDLSFVGDAASICRDERGVVFGAGKPDDHFFSDIEPIRSSGQGGWARLTTGWASGPRARVIIQDQDSACLASGATAPEGAAEDQVLVRLAHDTEEARIVILPGEHEAARLPQMIKLELHDAPQTGWLTRLLRR